MGPYAVLQQTGDIVPAIFFAFILFWSFAVMNILGGIFLEKTLSNANADREELALEKRRKDQQDTEALRKAFSDYAPDEASDGMLSHEEFHNLMGQESIINLLWFLG